MHSDHMYMVWLPRGSPTWFPFVNYAGLQTMCQAGGQLEQHNLICINTKGYVSHKRIQYQQLSMQHIL